MMMTATCAVGSQLEERRLIGIITFAGVAMLLAFVILSFLVVVESNQDQEAVVVSIKRTVFSEKNSSAASARKLLQSSTGEGDANRIGTGCSKDDIVIYQGTTAPLPNGIPTYSVQIVNVCVSAGCSISNIHVSCGWFSSARLINPTVFRRLYYDDCLVNDGEPLPPGECLSFQYSNSFSYPLSVSSVACCS